MDRELPAHRLALCESIGDEHVLDASPADSVDGITPRWIAEPGTADELARVLSSANSAGLRVIARGGGTKLGWGNAPAGVDVILSTRRLNTVIEHAAGDMTATVQAGCTFANLQEVLAKNGQRVAQDPHFADRATVGGILACNDSGALRLAFGSLRDCLIGITVALPDGTIAKSGGKVVKNVAGYDLPKLFIGSFGTLGVIVEATFRLYPLPHAHKTLYFTCDAMDDALARMLAAMGKCSPVTGAVLCDVTRNQPPIVQVRVEGLPTAMETKIGQVVRAAEEAGWKQIDGPSVTWSRDELFSDMDATVVKASLLPTKWPLFVKALRDAMLPRTAGWWLVGQSVGSGLLSIRGADTQTVVEIVRELRGHLNERGMVRDADPTMISDGQIAFSGGTLTVLTCPPAVKSSLDVWPSPGDALPLMRRIKSQFDPNNTLSPGRFVGGI